MIQKKLQFKNIFNQLLQTMESYNLVFFQTEEILVQ